MPEFPEVLSHLIPLLKPPSILVREGKFPSCVELYVRISKEPGDAEIIGRKFCRLCRVTALAWVFWAVNCICAAVALALAVWFWANDLDFSKSLAGKLSCKQSIALLLSCIFVSGVIYYIICINCQTLAESCDKEVEKAKNRLSASPMRAMLEAPIVGLEGASTAPQTVQETVGPGSQSGGRGTGARKRPRPR